MIEVEVKVAVSNTKALEEKLIFLGFLKGKKLRESDTYFDNAVQTFRNSDQALRVRQCENLTEKESVSYITYKGPKLDSVSMTRKELEMTISDAETGKEILKNLGFVPVRPVVKTRQYYSKSDITVCLDQVEGLGDFFEVEKIVESDADRVGALEEIFYLLEGLGFKKEQVIRTSYLSMLQAKT